MAAAAASPVRAQTILDLADAARGEAPIPRALRVAAAAGEDTAGLREAPLGHLHAAALGFHTALTGPRLEAVVTCPACASAVEFALDADSLRGLSGTAASGDLTVPTQAGAWRVRWRVPTAGDLAEVAGRTDAAATLLARCCDVTGPSGEDATLAPAVNVHPRIGDDDTELAAAGAVHLDGRLHLAWPEVQALAAVPSR